VGPLVREALGDAERLAGWLASSLPRREMVKALIEAYDESGAWPLGASRGQAPGAADLRPAVRVLAGGRRGGGGGVARRQGGDGGVDLVEE
jgi:hypothetical protein